MERKVHLERNKVFYLEGSMVSMYGIYNAETIEKLVNTSERKCIIKLYGMKGYLQVN